MGLSISTCELRTETGRWEGIGRRKSIKINENRWQVVSPGMGLSISTCEQRTESCEQLAEIIEKSMKIGDKRVPRRAASHFALRTTGRVGAVGGGRGREVYLLNLATGPLHALRP